MIRTLFLLIAILTIPVELLAGACSSTIATTESCNVITRHGITWTLAANETVGQFIMGDYFVVDDGNVIVSSVSPGWTGSKNGSQLNPAPGDEQPFDSAGENYNSVERASFPLAVGGGDCLVSTISITTESDNWAGAAIGHSHVKEAEFLTILSSTPASPSTTFRPAATDRTQNLYTTATLNTSLLPGLSLNGITPVTHSGFTATEYIERGVARPWIVWGNDWEARAIHPTESMYWYFDEIGEFLGEVELMLMTDQYTDAMLHGFLQIVIDYRYSKNRDSSNWTFHYIIGGLLLDSPTIYNYWVNYTYRRTQREHEKLFYPGEEWNDPPDNVQLPYDTVGTSSVVPAGECWTGYTHPVSGKCPMFAKQTDPSGTDNKYYYGDHLDPSEWRADNYCTAKISSPCKSEVYRGDSDVKSLIGQMLALIIIDAQTPIDANSKINHDVVRDYCDRWMDEPFRDGGQNFKGVTGQSMWEYMTSQRTFTQYIFAYQRGATQFITDMWNAYRDLEDATCDTPANGGTATACTDETSCTNAEYYWCDGACQATTCLSPPPVILSTSPSGVQVYTTTSVDLAVTTDENATCKYDTSSGTAYASMPNTMTGGGTTSHSVTGVSVSAGQSYNYYVVCNDTINDSDEGLISFNIAAGAVECGASYYYLCTDYAACTGAGFQWWENACRTISNPDDVIGSDQLLNGDFEDWTLPSVPDNWTRPDSAEGYAAENDGSLLLHTDSSSLWSSVRQDFGSPGDGKQYRYVLNTWGDDAAIYTENEGLVQLTTPGTYTGIITNNATNARFYLEAEAGSEKDVYFDDVVIKEVGSTPTDMATVNPTGTSATVGATGTQITIGE